MTAMGRRGPLGASDKIMGQFLPHHHHGVPPHCPATAHHTSAVWCLTTQPPLGLALTLVPRYVLYPFCLAVLLVCLFAAFCRFLAKVLVATNTAARLSVVVARTPFGCGSPPAAPWWGYFVGGGRGWPSALMEGGVFN